jgi:deoxyribonuclease V
MWPDGANREVEVTERGDAERDISRWDVTVPEAVALQSELRGRLVLRPPAGFAPRYVAGADISLDRDDPRGYAGLVVIDTTSMQTVDEATAVGTIGFPYVPGLLSFRELPLLARAWARLRVRPDVVVFDGQGYAHPRRFGVACHGGVLFGVPAVGCAKTVLVGRHGPLGEERGATAEMVDRREVVGMAMRLRARTKPVYVSAGHLMDLPTAVDVVLSVSVGFREPETTRRSHRLVNQLRLAERGSGA